MKCKTQLLIGNILTCLFIIMYTVATRYQDSVAWLSWLGVAGAIGMYNEMKAQIFISFVKIYGSFSFFLSLAIKITF